MNHKHYLLEALTLAKTRRGFCAPNPSVGAVIVNRSGEVIASGYHMGPGFPHAEVDAIKKLRQIPENAILYVTLEPCCHQGRTPPCTEAIIASGIKHVVYAYRDPNPIVSGKGEAVLHNSAITCEHVPISDINHFYESYQYWHKTKKPFIAAKIALTLDGKIAGKNSETITITGDTINQFTHLQRKEHDAILTTGTTIIADNPQLNARYENEIIQKPIYILDRYLNLPVMSKIFVTSKSITVFHKCNPDKHKLAILTQMGVRCVEVPEDEQGLTLDAITTVIGDDGIHSLWIEAGGKCFTSFIEKQLLQRAYIYIAPWQYGEGKVAFQPGFQFDFTSQSIQWKQYGQDVLCEINWR